MKQNALTLKRHAPIYRRFYKARKTQLLFRMSSCIMAYKLALYLASLTQKPPIRGKYLAT